MITKEQILMFNRSAKTLFESKDYTSSCILYFKTLFAIHDYILVEKTGESPKDHNHRFRMLKKHFPEIYDQLDLEFSTYRDTYSKIINLETCQRIKSIIEHDLEQFKINN